MIKWMNITSFLLLLNSYRHCPSLCSLTSMPCPPPLSKAEEASTRLCCSTLLCQLIDDSVFPCGHSECSPSGMCQILGLSYSNSLARLCDAGFAVGYARGVVLVDTRGVHDDLHHKGDFIYHVRNAIFARKGDISFLSQEVNKALNASNC